MLLPRPEIPNLSTNKLHQNHKKKQCLHIKQVTSTSNLHRKKTLMQMIRFQLKTIFYYEEEKGTNQSNSNSNKEKIQRKTLFPNNI